MLRPPGSVAPVEEKDAGKGKGGKAAAPPAKGADPKKAGAGRRASVGAACCFVDLSIGSTDASIHPSMRLIYTTCATRITYLSIVMPFQQEASALSAPPVLPRDVVRPLTLSLLTADGEVDGESKLDVEDSAAGAGVALFASCLMAVAGSCANMAAGTFLWECIAPVAGDNVPRVSPSYVLGLIRLI